MWWGQMRSPKTMRSWQKGARDTAATSAEKSAHKHTSGQKNQSVTLGTRVCATHWPDTPLPPSQLLERHAGRRPGEATCTAGRRTRPNCEACRAFAAARPVQSGRLAIAWHPRSVDTWTAAPSWTVGGTAQTLRNVAPVVPVPIGATPPAGAAARRRRLISSRLGLPFRPWPASQRDLAIAPNALLHRLSADRKHDHAKRQHDRPQHDRPPRPDERIISAAITPLLPALQCYRSLA